MPIEAMEICSDLFYDKSLHSGNVILIYSVASVFVSMTVDGVTSFLASKN